MIGSEESSSLRHFNPELQEKIDELEAAQQNLEAIINNISDAIIIHDDTGRIISWNNQARKVFNCSDEEKATITLRDLFTPDMRVNELESTWAEVLEGKTRILEWGFHQLNAKRKIPMQISINKTFWNGKTALVSVLRDFTEQKKHEQELIIARKKAEESDRLKSAFLANLSHEIRTPMNAIMGFTEFLKRPDLESDKRNTFISIVQESGNHLLSIIDDIIEISKIETGQISPHIGNVNIHRCIQDLFNALSVTMPQGKNVKLILELPENDSNITIRTDKVKVCQVLTNLISNAIKYTERGHVIIGYKVNHEDNDLLLFVKDTGEGIDAKYHHLVFDRFSRIESDLAVRMGGSGLGLAISKAYVEMLGGNIMLQSEPGRGSEFSFTIPLKIVRDEESGVEPEAETLKPEGNNELILLAEDEEINFLFFSRLFADKKYRLLRAKNGAEAVDMVRQNPEIRLILMDIKMPVLNGIMAFKQIRQIRPSVPVIAQTAHALPNEEKEIMSGGFDGYITKPIQEQKLFKLIHQLLHP